MFFMSSDGRGSSSRDGPRLVDVRGNEVKICVDSGDIGDRAKLAVEFEASARNVRDIDVIMPFSVMA